MDVYDKLKILADAAKYDVACTSSGIDRSSGSDGIGSAMACGICHAFSGDGRCISLLKILMSNDCAYDCKYCVNRVSNDVPRATFTPEEIATLTIEFYRRNYIEGLFLSSGVYKNPTETVERMTSALKLLREEYKFYGYIHVKAIPGASPESIQHLGLYADRMSVNIEMPSEGGLKLLAPQKTKLSIMAPMAQIKDGIHISKNELQIYRNAPKFVPAGQSTQMIVGATPDSDFQILKLTESLYKKFELKRVFYSAYIPVSDNELLPTTNSQPPLLREHRLYQADWLLRYYGFKADEIVNQDNPFLNEYLDPKCNWAVNNMQHFPIELKSASYEEILRVPGIGVKNAKKILYSRRNGLSFEGLMRMGVALKRAKYFVTIDGKTFSGIIRDKDVMVSDLTGKDVDHFKPKNIQLSFFDKLDII